jgi:uncharacterized membrane protein YjdF
MKTTLYKGLAFMTIFLTWHLISHFGHLYGKIEWSDLLSHFLSGIGIGFLWQWVLENPRFGSPFNLNKKSHILLAILFIISFGVLVAYLWELIELAFGTFAPYIVKDYFYDTWDTLSDILANFTGAVVVSALFYNKYKNTKKIFISNN